MIKLDRVSKSFKNILAVKDISFEVEEGENLILLGTSGCGKTTTLKMINRLIEPDQGDIIVNDKNIKQENPEQLRRGIGYVMQNTGLFPHYSVSENIAIVPNLLKWPEDKIIERTRVLIEKLHLPASSLEVMPHELSGGQQQRVGLARALVTDPAVLLMDEPFGALDNVTRASIRKEFKALEEFTRKTIVMVTHDIQEAFELADRICLMDKGEVMQIGTPKEILYQPANDFVRHFIEGEKLTLEFKVTTLADLWDNLPTDTGNNFAEISSCSSVWEALETMRSRNNKLNIINDDKQRRSIDISSLISAFNQFQYTR